ncbi:hypothetical protein [Poriferisphaera sp. WC338]|uniref:hypothetical protein n=1 Tax=Poriferisphaera sp. WC338 TaxID=3425129 RepID=UPI003D812A02
MSSQIDEQLVQLVTEKVIEAIAAKQAGTLSSTAEIHPPAGTCTGDYSKFTEMKKRSVLQPAAASQQEMFSSPTQHESVLTGFVTARQLDDLYRDGKRDMLVAYEAQLTPLAQDFIKEKQITIKRASSLNSKQAAKLNVQGRWGWWIDGFCPVVQELGGKLQQRIEMISASQTGLQMIEIVQKLERMLCEKDVCGGLIFVPDASRAALYMNKSPHIRAVIGRCAQSLSEAQKQLGPNVVIIEYPYTKGNVIKDLVSQMMRSIPQPQPLVERELQQLTQASVSPRKDCSCGSVA